MRLVPLMIAGLIALPFGFAAENAAAQNKPMTSGHRAHMAPQMRRHGSGLHHPNRPKYHHHPGHAGYRSPHRLPHPGLH